MDVPARLGLKAVAVAQPKAQAKAKPKPPTMAWPWLGLALATDSCTTGIKEVCLDCKGQLNSIPLMIAHQQFQYFGWPECILKCVP
jgi:hypothetical protein